MKISLMSESTNSNIPGKKFDWIMLRNKILVLGTPLFFMIIVGTLWYKDSSYNNYKCETKDMAIKGVVDYTSGRSSYMTAHVDNIKRGFSFNIAKEIFKKGYPEYYSYEIGDSIIKKAHSKEITVKRGDSIALYILDCDN